MANTEVIDLIVATTAEALLYMLPIIAVLSAINFILTWLMAITMGMGKRTFKD